MSLVSTLKICLLWNKSSNINSKQLPIPATTMIDRFQENKQHWQSSARHPDQTTNLFLRVVFSKMIKQGAQINPDLHYSLLDQKCPGKIKANHSITRTCQLNASTVFEMYFKHTPPGFRTRAITSRYSTILWAVSMKKQVTTASHAPATSFQEPHCYTYAAVLSHQLIQ